MRGSVASGSKAAMARSTSSTNAFPPSGAAAWRRRRRGWRRWSRSRQRRDRAPGPRQGCAGRDAAASRPSTPMPAPAPRAQDPSIPPGNPPGATPRPAHPRLEMREEGEQQHVLEPGSRDRRTRSGPARTSPRARRLRTPRARARAAPPGAAPRAARPARSAPTARARRRGPPTPRLAASSTNRLCAWSRTLARRSGAE